MRKIAIIGFGGAGYRAAAEARRCDPGAQIDVYTDTRLSPSNPMLTTYYVKGALGYEALFPFGTQEDIEKKLALRIRCGTPVNGLEARERAVVLADGTEKHYDSILISTGARALVPPVPGRDLPGVFQMRTVEDAVYLKERLDEGSIRSGLVIGASWVGIKVVEDLVERGVDCTLIDGAQWAFSAAAFRETAERIHRDLERKGIKLAFGQMLSRIEREAGGRLTAVMDSGSRFSADVIAVCVGVRPNVELAKDTGIAVGRGILVDERMQTNIPGIYAAGDCCEAYELQSGQRRNIGVWYNAQKQGMVAGANMAGVPREFGGSVLLNLAHYLDYDFISIGDASSCGPGDEVYENESGRYYLRAVRSGAGLKCINMIGTADANGVVKSIFAKSFENSAAPIDTASVCYLKANGFPSSFIEFIGGETVD